MLLRPLQDFSGRPSVLLRGVSGVKSLKLRGFTVRCLLFSNVVRLQDHAVFVGGHRAFPKRERQNLLAWNQSHK